MPCQNVTLAQRSIVFQLFRCFENPVVVEYRFGFDAARESDVIYQMVEIRPGREDDYSLAISIIDTLTDIQFVRGGRLQQRIDRVALLNVRVGGIVRHEVRELAVEDLFVGRCVKNVLVLAN